MALITLYMCQYYLLFKQCTSYNCCINELVSVVTVAGDASFRGSCMSVTFFLVISFLASGDVCRLLITFANSLDPDQDRQNVGPDLDPNHLTLW